MQTSITDLIDSIRADLASSAAIGFRTDYKVTRDGSSRRYLVISMSDKDTFAVLSPRPSQREIGAKRVMAAAGVTEDAAMRLLDSAHALSEINDIGAWPVAPARGSVSVVLDDSAVGAVSYSSMPSFSHSYEFLSGLMGSSITSIDVHTGSVGGSTERKIKGTRRSWLSFNAHSGSVCSIAVPRFHAVFRDWLTGNEDAKDQSDHFIRRWGQQVHVGPGEFASAIFEIEKAIAMFNVQRIDLQR